MAALKITLDEVEVKMAIDAYLKAKFGMTTVPGSSSVRFLVDLGDTDPRCPRGPSMSGAECAVEKWQAGELS
jgi:hypothetical protein